jgi:hypothetical protein
MPTFRFSSYLMLVLIWSEVLGIPDLWSLHSKALASAAGHKELYPYGWREPKKLRAALAATGRLK